jgi:hypothetical protein
MFQRQASFVGMLVAIGILVGCSSGGSGGGGSTAAPTATLTANPTSIPQGQSTILSFTSTNADSGTINNNVGAVGLNSQVTVTPPATTTYPNTYTYTYTASGPGGSATANATVTVTAPTAVALTATPAAIVAGQTVALSWTSANATSVYIGPNVGAVSPVAGGTLTLPAGQAPSPTQTTTYTATATGADNQQVTATATVTVAPLTSFDGMLPDTSNASNTDIDPNGAIGTKQFMEYVNTEYQAYDRTTFQPVLTPSTGMVGQAANTPWKNPLNTTGGQITNCIGPGITLDVVIIFDRLASRWVIAGKAYDGTVTGSYYCIAVSNTDDASSPTFGWYAYAFSLGPVLGTNSAATAYVPDWAKLGTWPNAYYAAMDMLFDNNTPTESGVAVCAFDRNNMLNGNTMDPPQCFTDTIVSDPAMDSGGIYLGHSLIPADFNGTTPPPANRDEYLVSIQNPVNDGTTLTSTTFNLWDFHVDWTNPANTTHTLTPITVSTYTPGCYLFVPGEPAGTICVLEPPISSGGQHIDSVGDRFMPRFDYRNFGSYESFLVSHTVNTGLNLNQNPWQTGVRWYELRDSGTGAPSVYQYGLISPDDSQFRFLPSIAQDSFGNAAAGYSVSNNTTDPGINFSYWNLGTTNATPAEVPIFSGAGEEITLPTGSGKWGSYSSMTVDPIDDCTFWYVNEYWPTNSDWATRIAFFKLPSCQ